MKDTESIRALKKIFIEKDWFPKDEEEFVFDTFCDLLEVLEPEERALLIELTTRYYWIPGSEYEKHIKDTLKGIPLEFLQDIKKLFLFPVVKPTDEGKAKSGLSLVYDVKAMLPTIASFRQVKPSVMDEFTDFKTNPGVSPDELLFLIDDFIGTGDTLQQCLTEIGAHMTIQYDRTAVICISCQEETYEALTSQGVKVYTKFLVKKGISDFNDGPTTAEKKRLMRSLEQSIPGASSFSLGYQESEALITLKRTPDNTFPVFWKKTRKEGKWFNAPFYRESTS